MQSIDPLAIPATTFGYALRGEEGNEKITNTSQSTVIGNFNLGDGTNTIDNNVSANFITDGIMFVGPTKESFFNNKGLLRTTQMPIRTIALNGSFAQYKTGTFQANLDYKINQIDRINATGTGSLDGALDVRIHNRALVNPGFYKKAFFTAGEGLLEEDLQLVVKRSAIVDYGIEHDANNAFLTTTLISKATEIT